MTAFIDGAKKNLSAYKDRMVMVRDEQPVVPGVVGIFTLAIPSATAATPSPPATPR
ncbi:hypothetical protein ACFQU2_22140 [Siccirubricoccus deserti]